MFEFWTQLSVDMGYMQRSIRKSICQCAAGGLKENTIQIWSLFSKRVFTHSEISVDSVARGTTQAFINRTSRLRSGLHLYNRMHRAFGFWYIFQVDQSGVPHNPRSQRESPFDQEPTDWDRPLRRPKHANSTSRGHGLGYICHRRYLKNRPSGRAVYQRILQTRR